MVRLKLFNLEDFLKLLKSDGVEGPVAISFLRMTRGHLVSLKLVATAYNNKRNIIYEYTHAECQFMVKPEEKQLDEIEKRREELVDLLTSKGFEVVSGVWLDGDELPKREES